MWHKRATSFCSPCVLFSLSRFPMSDRHDFYPQKRMKFDKGRQLPQDGLLPPSSFQFLSRGTRTMLESRTILHAPSQWPGLGCAPSSTPRMPLLSCLFFLSFFFLHQEPTPLTWIEVMYLPSLLLALPWFNPLLLTGFLRLLLVSL